MAYWRSFRSLIPAAALFVGLVLAYGLASAQEGTTTTDSAATAAPPTEFRRDLPSEVPEPPPPPIVRPQGSFFSIAASQGGPIFWVLVVMAIGAILVAVERFMSLQKGRTDVSRFMGEVNRALQEKGLNGALEICSRRKGPISQVVTYGLQRATRGPEGVEKAVATATLANLITMRRGLGILNFVGQTAPLIGFLGTVMGLLHAFDSALDSNRVNAAQAIGGISEAVVTTTTGIAVAIIVNVFINLITARIDRLSVQMEEAGDELVDSLIQNQGRLKGRTA